MHPKPASRIRMQGTNQTRTISAEMTGTAYSPCKGWIGSRLSKLHSSVGSARRASSASVA